MARHAEIPLKAPSETPGSERGSARTAPAEKPSAATVRASDAALLELLRCDAAPGVGDLASSLGVTATAVRQRLDRLMREGVVTREVVRPAGESDSTSRPRGRPAFVYRLTDKGRRFGGDNFRDLAMILWREVRSVAAPEVRRGLVSRIGASLATLYRPHIAGSSTGNNAGDSVRERLERTANLLRDRDIACSVSPAPDGSGVLAILTSHVCPYPELAEQDRGICAAERSMLQDLLGAGVRLASCRLDGAESCRFEVGEGCGCPSEASRQTDCPATGPVPAGAVPIPD